MADHDQRIPGEPVESEPVESGPRSLHKARQRRAARRILEAIEHDEPVGPEMTRDLHTCDPSGMVPEIFRKPLRSILERGEDWLSLAPPRREFLLRRNGFGAYPQGIVGLIAGPGGRGKSWILCQLALCVATGREWLDTFEVTRPGRVLLALAEEEDDEIRRRLYYAAKALGLSDEEMADAAANIVPLGLHGKTVGLVEGENRKVTTTAVYDELRRQIEGGEFRLLIFDPLSRFAPDVESNNAAVTAAVQAFEALTKGPGNPSVMVCHHSNKQSRVDGSKGGANMVRGVTGLTDAVRWEAQLVGKGEDDLALHFSKGNYGPAADDLPLVRGEHGVIRAIDPEAREEQAREAEAEKLKPVKTTIRKIIAAHPECTKGTVIDLAPHGANRVRLALKQMLIAGEVLNVGEEGERKAWKLVLP